jgi:hypothetical protein
MIIIDCFFSFLTLLYVLQKNITIFLLVTWPYAQYYQLHTRTYVYFTVASYPESKEDPPAPPFLVNIYHILCASKKAVQLHLYDLVEIRLNS